MSAPILRVFVYRASLNFSTLVWINGTHAPERLDDATRVARKLPKLCCSSRLYREIKDFWLYSSNLVQQSYYA